MTVETDGAQRQPAAQLVLCLECLVVRGTLVVADDRRHLGDNRGAIVYVGDIMTVLQIERGAAVKVKVYRAL